MRAQLIQTTNNAAPRRASAEPVANQDAVSRVGAVLRRDPSEAASLTESLKQSGIEAVTIENVEALRGLLSGNQFDVLILDNEMDGFFTGLEIIRKLRETLVRVPAILIRRNSESGPLDASSVPGVTVIDAAAGNGAIVRAALRTIVRAPAEANNIPERARSIVERQSDLPVLSHLTIHLLPFLEIAPEKIPIADLCRLIAIDPRATAVVLKAANASMNGMSREVANVPDAIRVLGVRPAIGRVLDAAVTAGLGALAKGLPREAQIFHARRGMILACVTSTMCQELEGRSGEAGFLIGVIQDVGMLVLLRAAPKQYQAALQRWRTIGHLKLAALEQADFDCNHAEVSAAMLERWGMPASFLPAVLHHLIPREGVSRLGIDTGLHRVTTIAEALADTIELPHPSRRCALNAVLSEYEASKRSLCLRSLKKATDTASEAFQLLALPLPSAEQLESLVRSTISESFALPEGETAAAATV